MASGILAVRGSSRAVEGTTRLVQGIIRSVWRHMIQDWVAGETGARQFTLFQNSAPFVIPDGATVELVLIDSRDGVTVITTTGDVTIVDAPTGVVQYSPDPDDLAASQNPLWARFKVTTTAGLSSFFPTGEPDTWNVRAI